MKNLQERDFLDVNCFLKFITQSTKLRRNVTKNWHCHYEETLLYSHYLLVAVGKLFDKFYLGNIIENGCSLNSF